MCREVKPSHLQVVPLRNVHEGGLPVDIKFTDDAKLEELSVRAGEAPDYELHFSPARFQQLIRSASS
jgi:hypothetical protein